MSAEFNLETFVTEPSLQVVRTLKKSHLQQIASHFKLSTTTTTRKEELCKLVMEFLVDEELVPEETVDDLPSHAVDNNVLELKRLELQDRERERESQLKLRELELREKELSVQLKMKELEKAVTPVSSPGATTAFDVSKHIRFVPQFQEKEVDKYFLHFEKVATSLAWPKEVWMVLLQSVLTGKAREIYSALSVEQSAQYDHVKQVILKAYELVPEAYRQNFRKCGKDEKQTYIEFARTKQALFDRWCTSKEVAKDYEKLRQMILLEEFKNCLPDNIKTYIEERKADNLQQAATLADDYSLTHRSSFITPSNLRGSTTQVDQSNRSNPNGTPVKKLVGHTADGQRPRQSRNGSGGPTCNYCKRRGHVISECWTLERKRNNPSSDLLVSTVNPPTTCIITPVENIDDTSSSTDYHPFVSEGYVSLSENGETVGVKILRDTGATQSLLVDGTLPLSEQTSVGASVLIQGVGLDVINVPLHQIFLKSELVSGPVIVGTRPTLPVDGISLILGNDLAGGRVQPDPHVVNNPNNLLPANEVLVQTFPACVVTRAAARRAQAQVNSDPNNEPAVLGDTLPAVDSTQTESGERQTVKESQLLEKASDFSISRGQLVREQESDEEVTKLAKYAINETEASQEGQCFYWKSGVLMRKWRPRDVPADEEWTVVHQIVMPRKYRREILSLAHESAMAGHLGVNKTYLKILNHFYWPHLRRDVSEYCKSCHVCQMVGKPNETIPVAPLKPIPACGEPFSEIIIDCVGPLPKTKSGNQYLLTIMCRATRFPEAFPLRNIKAPRIVESLVKFFSLVGLPTLVQSDQGSNFMSNVMQQVTFELGIKQCKSAAYHPESQGALERFHQTLKNMIRAYCFQYERQWDQGIHLLLFAVREAVQESLGFSPFELVFGRTVRGPLKVLKESWLIEESPINLLDQVSTLRNRLTVACELAQRNMKSAQTRMKKWYDKNAKQHHFRVGDKVLVLLPLQNHPLQARYFGPYSVAKKVNEVDYVINTPDRRKAKRLCHVNMMKPYVERAGNKEQPVKRPVPVLAAMKGPVDPVVVPPVCNITSDSMKLKNSVILGNLKTKLHHLSCTQQQTQFSALLQEFADVFPDVPRQTTLVSHDVEVGDSRPIKQHPYRVNPVKLEVMKKEIDYMLSNGIIEPSHSEWSSPCLLVDKGDGGYRFCTDFRKVNLVTKADSYPIPRIEDCIDKVGSSQYVSKFDLLKGYWQVPLTPRAREISAFVTPAGFYQYRVMPFGMKNAPATFQRMIHQVIDGLEGCEGYIDDIIVFSDTWEQHLQRVKAFLTSLRHAQLTVNLAKCEFGQACVTYLGHVVGRGEIRPIHAKVDAIVNFPVPTNKSQLMRFLGMVGYYRKFCNNFAVVAEPLTRLLQKKQTYIWKEDQRAAFGKVKRLLTSAPVLAMPDFERPFIIHVDASDLGLGAVLMQESIEKLEHPIGYFSQKFNKSQKNYSTSEKEALALILSLQHFEFYIVPAKFPIDIYTDHNPLVFLNRIKNKNQRLLRWSLSLQEYNLNIMHIPGRRNVVADALSRGL